MTAKLLNKEADYLMRISEVAETCDCSDATVRRWIHTQRLPAVPMPGGQYRVWASELDKLLQVPV